MKTCGECQHWCKRPPDAANLGAPSLGECRAVPPQLITLPARGGIAVQVTYPAMPAEFPACGQFRQSLRVLPPSPPQHAEPAATH